MKIDKIDEVYVYCSNEKIKDYLPDGVIYLKRSESLDTDRTKMNEVLTALRNDREKSWLMFPDGNYIREQGGEGTSSQEGLYRYFSNRKVSLIEEVPDEPEEPEKPAIPEEPEAVREETPRQEEKTKRRWFRRMFG